MRTLLGVTSTISSSLMYSSASSSDMMRGSSSPTLISLDAARMLVSALVLHTLILRSPALACCPTHCPSYTASPGRTNICPRSCALSSAYEVTAPVSCATSDPASRMRISPASGAYSRNSVFMTPMPRVAVSMALRSPSRPRVAMRNLRRDCPSSDGCRSVISPLRCANSSTTAPTYCSGTSTTASSYGSTVLPPISLVITLGGPISNSKPSRRMFSIRMPRCSVPRPDTTNASAVSPGSTRSARLRSSSRSRRSLRLREVTNLPSLPAKGEVLTLNVMDTVGSSTSIVSSAMGLPRSQIVSPILMSEMPDSATMSPADTSSTGTRLKLSYTNSSAIFWVRTLPGSSEEHTDTCCPLRMVPAMTRPTPMRPRCVS
mmetsp:Transcript_30297/g.77258  ORF Transcript_30297/g.77258 Transcript_30297/m.77258 type:complete len:375 (-) Transcript_30297:982-2106(-)